MWDFPGDGVNDWQIQGVQAHRKCEILIDALRTVALMLAN